MITEFSRDQSVVDKLWKKANELVEHYDGEMYGSFMCTNMSLRILEDKLMTSEEFHSCLLYTSPSPRDATLSRMPSSA